MKRVLSSMQERLRSEVPELRYIGKERGQLSDANADMEFPCALLDIGEVAYTQEGKGVRMADIRIAVTVAHLRDSSDESDAESYRAIEVLESVDAALHLFEVRGFAPLSCTGVRKIAAEGGVELYEMSYATVCRIGRDTGESGVLVRDVDIEIR